MWCELLKDEKEFKGCVLLIDLVQTKDRRTELVDWDYQSSRLSLIQLTTASGSFVLTNDS